MKTKIAALYLFALLAGLAGGFVMLRAGAALADGSGSAAAEVTPAPHDQLHDPIAQPVETIRDLSDAAKVSWVALAAAVVLILCKLAGYLKSRLKWLAQGWRPFLFTALTALAGGIYDAVRLGGTGVALLVAGLVALAAAIPGKGPETT